MNNKATPSVLVPAQRLSGVVARGWRALGWGLGGLLLADALVLMAVGHFNVGVVVPAVLGAGLLLLLWQWPAVLRWRQARAAHARLWRLACWGLGLWLLSLAVFWSRLLGLGVPLDQVPPVQAIVVLGSGTLNGEPRPALAERLDTAAALARLQPQALVAVCGGVDWGETESEAAVMARYLRQRHGIAAERLVLEAASTSTALNLELSRPLLQARGVAAQAPQALVTSDFHLMRALGIARQQGLGHMVPVAASTPLATRFNAWLREYFAMASSWVLREV